jgi:hypothetical protein
MVMPYDDDAFNGILTPHMVGQGSRLKAQGSRLKAQGSIRLKAQG